MVLKIGQNLANHRKKVITNVYNNMAWYYFQNHDNTIREEKSDLLLQELRTAILTLYTSGGDKCICLLDYSTDIHSLYIE